MDWNGLVDPEASPVVTDGRFRPAPYPSPLVSTVFRPVEPSRLNLPWRPWTWKVPDSLTLVSCSCGGTNLAETTALGSYCVANPRLLSFDLWRRFSWNFSFVWAW